MRVRQLLLLVPSVLTLGLVASGSSAADSSSVRSQLLGTNENPIVLSDGNGSFDAQILNGEISFRLSYRGLVDVLQAHIHVAHPWDNGGIAVFLCTNLGNTPAGATERPCPESGTVSGTILPDDVQAVSPIAAGDLEGLVQLLRDGATYVNVHTVNAPGGELRGQTNPRRR